MEHPKCPSLHPHHSPGPWVVLSLKPMNSASPHHDQSLTGGDGAETPGSTRTGGRMQQSGGSSGSPLSSPCFCPLLLPCLWLPKDVGEVGVRKCVLVTPDRLRGHLCPEAPGSSFCGHLPPHCSHPTHLSVENPPVCGEPASPGLGGTPACPAPAQEARPSPRAPVTTVLFPCHPPPDR